MEYINDIRKVDIWMSDTTMRNVEKIAGELGISVGQVITKTCNHIFFNRDAIEALKVFFVRDIIIDGVTYYGRYPSVIFNDKSVSYSINFAHVLKVDLSRHLSPIKQMAFALNMPVRDTVQRILNVCYGDFDRKKKTINAPGRL